MARFVYIDEAGISNPSQEPIVVVASLSMPIGSWMNLSAACHILQTSTFLMIAVKGLSFTPRNYSMVEEKYFAGMILN